MASSRKITTSFKKEISDNTDETTMPTLAFAFHTPSLHIRISELLVKALLHIIFDAGGGRDLYAEKSHHSPEFWRAFCRRRSAQHPPAIPITNNADVDGSGTTALEFNHCSVRELYSSSAAK